MHAVETFARFATGFAQTPLPTEVAHHAQRAVIDWYASIYPGLDTPAVQVLMQTGVLVTEYPKLIADYKKCDEAGFWRRFKTLSWRMGLGGGAACLLAGFALLPIVRFVDKPLALEHMNLFYLMLFAFWIKFQADVSNYALYARHQDKALSLSYFCNLLVASLSNIACVWFWGLAGAGIRHQAALSNMPRIWSIKCTLGTPRMMRAFPCIPWLRRSAVFSFTTAL